MGDCSMTKSDYKQWVEKNFTFLAISDAYLLIDYIFENGFEDQMLIKENEKLKKEVAYWKLSFNKQVEVSRNRKVQNER
jgi:hypothetical protein